MAKKRIAIIGAGPGGLAAAKSALEEGMDPVVFERLNHAGGVWGENGLAWPGMQGNVSKFNNVYSDFPYQETTTVFPSTEEMREYLADYIKQNNLQDHLHYNRTVINIRQDQAKWVIRWQENQNQYEECFDAVIVANGKYAKINMPNIPGLENFSGEILHSSRYRSDKDYSDKNVLVIGGSISGTCIADSLRAKQVTHSVRRPRWIFTRFIDSPYPDTTGKIPFDLAKSLSLPQPVTAEEKFNFYAIKLAKQQTIPSWKMERDKPFAAVIADTYLDKIVNKQIDVQPGITHFADGKVYFSNGEAKSFDTIICCTGFHPDLAFMDADFYKKDLRHGKLYKDTFPIDLPNLAFLGFYSDARGGAFPLLELQARWACAVLSGKKSLPSQEKMRQELNLSTSQLDGIQFAEELAKEIDALPNLANMDAELAKILTTGALIPARFRLQGEHSNKTVAEQIIRATEQARQLFLTPIKRQNENLSPKPSFFQPAPIGVKNQKAELGHKPDSPHKGCGR